MPTQFVISSTADAAALVTGLRAYTTGLSFNIEIRTRPKETHSSPTWFYDGPGRVRFGLELPNGSAVFPHTPQGIDWPPTEEDRPEGPVLIHTAGGGSDDTFTFGLWLTPLPLEDRFTVVFTWPAGHMPETRCVVELGDLQEVALNAQQIW